MRVCVCECGEEERRREGEEEDEEGGGGGGGVRVCLSTCAHAFFSKKRKTLDQCQRTGPVALTSPKKLRLLSSGAGSRRSDGDLNQPRCEEKKRLEGTPTSNPNPEDSGGLNLFHRSGVGSSGSGVE